jgi:hypothetical protein
MKKVFALLAIVGFVACNNAETKVEEKKADSVVTEAPKADSTVAPKADSTVAPKTDSAAPAHH